MLLYQALPLAAMQAPQKQKKGAQGTPKNTTKPDRNRPEIKQVPQSRKQPKPTVVKPKIKIKPIKVNKPKIRKP
ncbi:hypothetical protein C7T94_09450 [Pedobacter yulinensis]|uniref:Uncharacterized protein n=1 Tax=Pedobacter yulinensis TaxID=2126353 RepID=A0A2T3HKC2_9SPHI|nr:hypothetical protein C7T94_09450 [Pedobacter yulinensis]